MRSDTAHIRKDGTGVRTVAISDLAEHPGVDLAAYEGASSGRPDIDDLATISDDSVAVVVVLENVWVLGMVDRWSRSGVRTPRRSPGGSGSATSASRWRRR